MLTLQLPRSGFSVKRVKRRGKIRASLTMTNSQASITHIIMMMMMMSMTSTAVHRTFILQMTLEDRVLVDID